MGNGLKSEKGRRWSSDGIFRMLLTRKMGNAALAETLWLRMAQS